MVDEHVPVACIGSDESVPAITPPENLAVVSVFVVVV
jgi:hypothetical protein